MHFTTDHRLVWGAFAHQLQFMTHKRTSAPRNWRPSDSWWAAVDSIQWDWHDWNTMSSQWSDLAKVHQQRRPRHRDEVLCSLLQQHSVASQVERKRLNKHIWRHRRATKRWRAKRAILAAAERGCKPQSGVSHATVNWGRICGCTEPSEFIHDFYRDIYSVERSSELAELQAKERAIGTWRSLRIDLGSYRVSDRGQAYYCD